MKLFGLGMKLLRRGQSSCTNGCHHDDALPPCPPKPLWTGARVVFFSLFTFGAGVYTGVYVSQNYEVPRVEDPTKLVEKINKKLNELVDGKK